MLAVYEHNIYKNPDIKLTPNQHFTEGEAVVGTERKKCLILHMCYKKNSTLSTDSKVFKAIFLVKFSLSF